jgi:hypothetical protein
LAGTSVGGDGLGGLPLRNLQDISVEIQISYGVEELKHLVVDLCRMGTKEVAQGSNPAFLHHENIYGMDADIVRKIDEDLGGNARPICEQWPGRARSRASSFDHAPIEIPEVSECVENLLLLQLIGSTRLPLIGLANRPIAKRSRRPRPAAAVCRRTSLGVNRIEAYRAIATVCSGDTPGTSGHARSFRPGTSPRPARRCRRRTRDGFRRSDLART